MIKKIITIISVTLAVILTWALSEPFFTEINRAEFRSTDIPESFNGKKIVFAADIHHGPFFGIERVRKIVKEINSLKPEIILLGGDYITEDKKYIEPVFRELKNLKSSVFTGAIFGNHDHWESTRLSRKYLKESDITNLNNRSKWINIGKDRIKIGGVGDLWEDMQKPENTTAETKDSDLVILLSHNPDYFKSINASRIDLVLSGHTHGGQVTLFDLWAPYLPVKNKEFRRGFYRKGRSTMFITKGIGTSILPLRLFCRPEIVEITLIKTKEMAKSNKSLENKS